MLKIISSVAPQGSLNAVKRGRVSFADGEEEATAHPAFLVPCPRFYLNRHSGRKLMLQTHLGSADLHATFFPCAKGEGSSGAKGEGSSGAKGEGSSGASPKKHILQVVHTCSQDLTDTRNAVCVGGWVCVGMCVPLCVCVPVWEWVGALGCVGCGA